MKNLLRDIEATHTLLRLLKASTHPRCLRGGPSVHAHFIKTGNLSPCSLPADQAPADCYLANTLVSTYMKGGCVEEARRLFQEIASPNVISWTSVVSGLVDNGRPREALEFYKRMIRSGVHPNHYTFSNALRAAAAVAVGAVQQLHAAIIKSCFDAHFYVAPTLLHSYSFCKSVEFTCQVFEEMSPKATLLCWSSVISLFVHSGNTAAALRFVSRLWMEGGKADVFVYASALRACAQEASLSKGRSVHTQFIRAGIRPDVSLENALIYMYLQCGSLDDANLVFHKMLSPNSVTWTSMIYGYAQHGQGKKSLELFRRMTDHGVPANHVTFVGVLWACSNMGLVNEGQEYFRMMVEDFGIRPRIEHCVCIVDLLGRAGCLEDAENFIRQRMGGADAQSEAVAWRAVLCACREHGNLEVGRRAAERLVSLGLHDDAASFVVMANMFAAAGMWETVGIVRKAMKERGIRKQPGLSWIEIGHYVHCFVSGDSLEQSKLVS